MEEARPDKLEQLKALMDLNLKERAGERVEGNQRFAFNLNLEPPSLTRSREWTAAELLLTADTFTTVNKLKNDKSLPTSMNPMRAETLSLTASALLLQM